MTEHGARYLIFKLLGGLMFGMSCLGVLSFVVTFGIQLISNDAFPELPIWATAFAGAMSALMAYIGWRFVVAKPEEMKPFTGR